MSPPVIECVDVVKRFGALTAVDALSLSVRQGEVFGYLGPNGAGKTTTIRMLLDALRPTAGQVTVLGRSPADPAVRARIGYLPADLPVDPRWTAQDLLDFYGALRGRHDRAWVGELLRRFDLDATRPVGQLSTGNRRKVAILAAVAHRPDVLIVDEPTSGLDPLLQYEFHQLVRESVAGGATVFLSSHVLPEVEHLADRVGILRRGRLVAVSTVDELRADARTRIDLRLAVPADTAVFAGIPEVVEAQALDHAVRLTIEGSVDAVIKAAATLPVTGIRTYEADLEEVFLSYYQDNGDGQDEEERGR